MEDDIRNVAKENCHVSNCARCYPIRQCYVGELAYIPESDDEHFEKPKFLRRALVESHLRFGFAWMVVFAVLLLWYNLNILDGLHCSVY